MTTYFLIYLFMSIEKISSLMVNAGLFFHLGCVALIMMAFIGVMCCNGDSDFKTYWGNVKGYRKTIYSIMVAALIISTMGKLIPDRKDLAIIIGAGATYNILTSPEAKELGGKSLDVLRKYMDDALKDEKVGVTSSPTPPPEAPVKPSEPSLDKTNTKAQVEAVQSVVENAGAVVKEVNKLSKTIKGE
jgi:hypothetical protein